jgi:hypothetical protein
MSYANGPRIVTDGLVLCLDAGNRKSYPGSGDMWYDLSGNNAHAQKFNAVSFTEAGSQSYWQFGIDDKFNSIDISQEYRDLFVLMKLENNSTTINMVFGHYNNLDDSFRTWFGRLRSGPNGDDWEYGESSKVFANGSFNAGNTYIYDQWSLVRLYRSNNTGFGTSFRYEISSRAGSPTRSFIGKINYVACYNRELNNAEVLQNYNALKGRFGL